MRVSCYGVYVWLLHVRIDLLFHLSLELHHLDDLILSRRTSVHFHKAVEYLYHYSSSTICILSPIHRMTGTAMLFPIALYRGPSGQSSGALLRQGICV